MSNNKSWKYFFRHDICCAIMWDNNTGLHWGYVGVQPTHPLNGTGYHKVAGIGLYSSYMGSDFSFRNSALDEKYWLGFQSNSPMSFDKTLEDIKRVADALAKEFATDKEEGPGGFKFL